MTIFQRQASLLRPLLAITLLGTALAACQSEDTAIEERLRPVRFVLVSDDNNLRGRNFTGTSKSSRESRLSFKVGGTVTRLPVQIGQSLKKGELIAELDSTSYDLQTQQARASLIEAQANDRQATSNYERTKGLYANDNASRNELDSARAQAESTTAVVASARKALEIAQLNSSYTRLVADTDCSIASLSIEINENVSVGQQIAAVSCGSSFEVTLDLPESLIARVSVATPVSVRFGAIPQRVFEGRVNEIAVVSAADSAAYPIVVGLLEAHPSLRSGMAADVTFQFETSAANGSSIVLPLSAVVNDPEGSFVFIAEPDGDAQEAIVRRQNVSLGELTQSGVEIRSGLAVGDRVITAGISVIRDGQRVLIR